MRLYVDLGPRFDQDRYRPATIEEVINALVGADGWTALVEAARQRTHRLTEWDEWEADRWMISTATGPDVAHVYRLHGTAWAWHIDRITGGLAPSIAAAKAAAERVLVARGWQLPERVPQAVDAPVSTSPVPAT